MRNLSSGGLQKAAESSAVIVPAPLQSFYKCAAIRLLYNSSYVLAWVLPISFFAFVLSQYRNDPDDPATRLRRLMQKV